MNLLSGNFSIVGLDDDNTWSRSSTLKDKENTSTLAICTIPLYIKAGAWSVTTVVWLLFSLQANVTLGIPRLREILMTATRSIKTPIMTLPLQAGTQRRDAALLANRLKRIKLAECLKGLKVGPSVSIHFCDSSHHRDVIINLSIMIALSSFAKLDDAMNSLEIALDSI